MELILFFLTLAAIAYGNSLDFEDVLEAPDGVGSSLWVAGKPLNTSQLFEFRLDGSKKWSERPPVASAELLVRVEKAPKSHTLVVYTFIPNDVSYEAGRAEVNVEEWQRVNVTGEAQRWAAEGLRELRLQLVCLGCPDYVLKRLGRFKESRPLLHLRLHPPPARMRPAGDCDATTTGSCCRHTKYVSFRKLGWHDWIVSPEGYYASYCRDTCAASSHSRMEHEPTRWCAPVSYSNLSLVYFGRNSNFHELVFPRVEECGCT